MPGPHRLDLVEALVALGLRLSLGCLNLLLRSLARLCQDPLGLLLPRLDVVVVALKCTPPSSAKHRMTHATPCLPLSWLLCFLIIINSLSQGLPLCYRLLCHMRLDAGYHTGQPCM